MVKTSSNRTLIFIHFLFVHDYGCFIHGILTSTPVCNCVCDTATFTHVCVCVHINIHVWYRHECVHLRENYFVSREWSSCGRRHAQTLSNHSVMSVFNTVIMPRFKDFPVSSESARRIQELQSLIVNATLEDHIWTSA